MANAKTNDEWKPKCPRCRGMNFIAVYDRHLQNTDKGVALIVCTEEECQTVIGALPYDSVWD
jgi:hypothetical protein